MEMPGDRKGIRVSDRTSPVQPRGARLKMTLDVTPRAESGADSVVVHLGPMRAHLPVPTATRLAEELIDAITELRTKRGSR